MFDALDAAVAAPVDAAKLEADEILIEIFVGAEFDAFPLHEKLGAVERLRALHRVDPLDPQQ